LTSRPSHAAAVPSKLYPKRMPETVLLPNSSDALPVPRTHEGFPNFGFASAKQHHPFHPTAKTCKIVASHPIPHHTLFRAHTFVPPSVPNLSLGLPLSLAGTQGSPAFFSSSLLRLSYMYVRRVYRYPVFLLSLLSLSFFFLVLFILSMILLQL